MFVKLLITENRGNSLKQLQQIAQHTDTQVAQIVKYLILHRKPLKDHGDPKVAKKFISEVTENDC